MSGPGRLSLRARLLVLLVAVTAAFLVIMGAVTTVVLSRQLTGRFNAGLAAAVARSPQALRASPGEYLAAAVPRRSGDAVLLTPGSLGQQFQQSLGQLTRFQLRRDFTHQPFQLMLADGTRLRARARLAPAATVGSAALPRGLVLLVVARPVDQAGSPVGGVVIAELITGAGLLMLLAIGGQWLIGQGLSPLGTMATTAHQITTRGDLTARMPEAGDATEVGRLGAAINTMLDRIQQAFTARLRSEEKVRQFAADASHELRTPLTTIRGYAELYQQGALGPAQLPDAMRRIDQESRRMSTLVAELLELARLDRGSSLDLAETDLAAVVRDAVADAHAVEPSRPVQAETPDRLVAVVDEARIRQVLANLLGNVREHTPPATPVAVRLAQVRGGVVLEVADAGPGMSASDAARAFDRFHRGPGRAAGEVAGFAAAPGPHPGQPGAPSGQPRPASGQPGVPPGQPRPASGQPGVPPGQPPPASGQARVPGGAPGAPPGPYPGNGHGPGGPEGSEGAGGGSGLGLSIVQAIAQAHGGQAVLESRPGTGTRVRIWLPAAVTG